MVSILWKDHYCFTLSAAFSLLSFMLCSCQPLLEPQVEATNTKAPLLTTATVTADELSTDTPTMEATTSQTATSTEEPAPSPTLRSPACFQLSYPGNGTTISGGSIVQFKWDAEPRAQLYILTVIHPDRSKTDVQTKNTNGSVSLKKASKTATYTWYVNAFDINGNQICNSSVFYFTKKRGGADTPIAPPMPPATIPPTTDTPIAPLPPVPEDTMPPALP